MKEFSFGHFYTGICNKKRQFPLAGQIEFTYRCNLRCIYCYGKGSEDGNRELTTKDWKTIFNKIQKQGCVWLVFTGGEPLIREDFLELYAYAKGKGFIITLFTNAQALSKKILNFFAESPPYSIEVTLNGITKPTYEAITQVEGSFAVVTENIKRLKEKNLPLVLKSNCLKQNKDEIGKIKAFADEFLGNRGGQYHFKYDPLIYPRLNGDKAPVDFRLSFAQMSEVAKQDSDIWQEYKNGLHRNFPDLERNRKFLYHCNSWMKQFFINPYGRLKFCGFSDKFSVDLKAASFRKGFYNIFPRLLKEQFKTNSKCRDCRLRPICYHCPARAYLETGDEEAPVPYYCQLAEATAKEMRKVVSRKR